MGIVEGGWLVVGREFGFVRCAGSSRIIGLVLLADRVLGSDTASSQQKGDSNEGSYNPQGWLPFAPASETSGMPQSLVRPTCCIHGIAPFHSGRWGSVFLRTGPLVRTMAPQRKHCSLCCRLWLIR